MALTDERVFEIFEDIEANTPIACNWSLFAKADVHVYYGIERLEAVQNTDYTVALSSPNFQTFTITPLTSLINKINALIAIDDDEVNYVEVRRELSMLTSVSSSSARYSNEVSREFDRVYQRLQELGEFRTRVFSLSVRDPYIDAYDLTLPEHVGGRALIWHETEKRLVNSAVAVDDTPTATAVAAAAAAVAAAESAVPAAATATAQAAVAVAAAASILPVPTGGSTNDILAKTGAGPTAYAWTAPGALSVGPALAAATAKTTPVDADTLPLTDSEAASALKKITFANLWTWILSKVQSMLVPTGAVQGFLRSTAPTGWVALNGGSIGDASSGATTRANADTSALFALIWALDALDAAIQTSAGAGSTRGADAATDFAAHKRLVLPDHRGVFGRGWDNGRSVDTSRRLGSDQAESIGPHTHPLSITSDGDHQHTLTLSNRWGNDDGSSGWGSDNITANPSTQTRSTSVNGAHTHADSTATNNAGTENRPRNVASLICVKL